LLLKFYWESNKNEAIEVADLDHAKKLILRQCPKAVYGEWVPDKTKSGVQLRVMPVYENQEDMSDGRRIAQIKEFT
jgi:hypothetical protein